MTAQSTWAADAKGRGFQRLSPQQCAVFRVVRPSPILTLILELNKGWQQTTSPDWRSSLCLYWPSSWIKLSLGPLQGILSSHVLSDKKTWGQVSSFPTHLFCIIRWDRTALLDLGMYGVSGLHKQLPRLDSDEILWWEWALFPDTRTLQSVHLHNCPLVTLLGSWNIMDRAFHES